MQYLWRAVWDGTVCKHRKKTGEYLCDKTVTFTMKRGYFSDMHSVPHCSHNFQRKLLAQQPSFTKATLAKVNV